MAQRVADEGARFALMDIDAERVKATAAALRESGVEAFGLRVDVADRASVDAAAGMVAQRYGGCDTLCANVGVRQFESIEALTDQDWQ